MPDPKFVYVTYIASTPETVWQALIDPAMTRQYWGHDNVSDWQPGSRWEHRRTDAARTVDLVGTVVESVPPRRLVVTWADPRDAKHTRVTFEIEPMRGVVRLTVVHDELEPGSAMQRGIAEGWPMVLSGLKSMLETGHALPQLW